MHFLERQALYVINAQVLSLPLLEFRPVSIGALPQRVHFLVVVRSLDYSGFALTWDSVSCIPSTDARQTFTRIDIYNIVSLSNFDIFVFILSLS